MNAIQQISLKLQLGLDPASNIQSEQLLQKWQVFNARRCRDRAKARARQRLMEQNSDKTARNQTPRFRAG